LGIGNLTELQNEGGVIMSNLAERIINDKKLCIETDKITKNALTGEILSESNFKVFEPKFKFKSGSGLGRYSRYSKGFHLDIVDFTKSTYYKYFYYMERNLEQGTNRIVKHTENGSPNIPISDTELSIMTKTNIRTMRDFIKEAIQKNYIARLDKNSEFWGYVMNPIYSMNGDKLNLFLYALFNNDEFDKHIPKSDLKKIHNYLSERGYS